MQALIRQETRVSEESAEKVSEENADRHGLNDSFNLVVALYTDHRRAMMVSTLPSAAASRTSTAGINAKAWWSDMLERWLERIEKGSMELPFGEYAQQRANRQFIDLPLLDLPPFQVRKAPIYGFAQKSTYPRVVIPNQRSNRRYKVHRPEVRPWS